MFGNNIIKSFTLTGTLDKISKILGLANQAIPIYKEIKPMIDNTKKVFNLVKDGNQMNSSTKKIIEAKAIDNKSNLTFFQ